VRARHTLAEHLTLKPQLRGVANARALQLIGPLVVLTVFRLVAVAVDRAVADGVLAGVALAAEKLGHLVLQRRPAEP
jgi:hypothetical protein